MENNSIVGIEYPDLLQRIRNTVNLSFSEIREKYSDYPLCLINYFEKGIEEKLIEVRFDEQEISVTYSFNSDRTCNRVFLFTDRDEITERLILFLNETYKYDFIKNRWKVSGFYIKIKAINHSPDDICFMFYGQVD